MQTTERGNNRFTREGGVTLLEIIIAMLLLGLVAAGVMGAFVFGRRVSVRSATELDAAAIQSQIVENLRQAVGGDSPGGLRLDPGIYVDTVMFGRGEAPGATPLAALNFPAAFTRFQIEGNGSDAIPDGTVLWVEDWDDGVGPTEDLDLDGFAGFDFNGDGVTDLRRVHLRINWTSPTA